MTMKHEPRAEFIQRLEERVGAEVRRRSSQTVARAPRWMPRSPLAAAAALAAVVIVSMGVGGAVVAARYQAQDSQQRQQLAANVERRLQLAKAKLDVARSQMALIEQRVATGVESQDAIPEGRQAIVQGEVQISLLESQLAEVRVSGREPQDAISAPLVGGRDYVVDRLKMQLGVPRAALDLENVRLQRYQQRFAVGAATSLDVATSRHHIVELEFALRTLERKIAIRQQFRAKQLDEAMAELRVLEAEAEQRQGIIMPKLDLAKKVHQDFRAKVEMGVAAPFELKEAELRVYELELELKKAELDLSVVRRQIDQRKGK